MATGWWPADVEFDFRDLATVVSLHQQNQVDQQMRRR